MSQLMSQLMSKEKMVDGMDIPTRLKISKNNYSIFDF